MSRSATAVALLGALALGACDLPSGPQEAREHLARGENRTVSLELPFPSVEMKLTEQLGDTAGPFAGVVDTSDLSIRIAPDAFPIALGSYLAFDPVELDPTSQSFDMSVDPFESIRSVAADPVPVSLPPQSQTVTLTNTAMGGSADFPAIDYTASFTTATFAPNASLDVTLTTDADGSLTNASLILKDTLGNVIAQSPSSITVAANSTGTLQVPLAGETVPGVFILSLSFDASTGSGGGDDDVTADLAFTNSAVTAATGVDAGLITPAPISQTVALDQTSPDFSEAVLAAGTVNIKSTDFGDLVFTEDPAFDPDLSGKRVGGTNPDSITVIGTVDAPATATRVDITTQGSVTIELTDVVAEWITLNQVDFAFDQTVNVIDTSTGQFDGVEEILADTGSVRLDIVNRFPTPGDVTITLKGAERNGAQISQQATIPAAAPGDSVVTAVIMELDGATLVPDSLKATVTGSFTGSDVTVTSEVAAEAVRVTPRITLAPASVTVANAPGLAVDFDQTQTFTGTDLGLGDLAETMDGVELNDVTLTLALQNDAGIELTIDSLTLALVDPATSSPITDDAGNPIRLLVEEDASGQVVVPAHATDSVSVPASAFVNTLIQTVISGGDVGIQASGDTDFGSASGTIAAGDSIQFGIAVDAPFDITLPADGITFDQTSHAFVNLDSLAADMVADLGESLVSGAFDLDITNATPLGLSITIALAPTPADTTGFDPFNAAERFVISGLDMEPAQVDGGGVVSTPAETSTSVEIQGSELSVFKRGELSLGVKVTITPPDGGRAKITVNDYIKIDPTAKLEVSTTSATGGQQ